MNLGVPELIIISAVCGALLCVPAVIAGAIALYLLTQKKKTESS